MEVHALVAFLKEVEVRDVTSMEGQVEGQVVALALEVEELVKVVNWVVGIKGGAREESTIITPHGKPNHSWEEVYTNKYVCDNPVQRIRPLKGNAFHVIISLNIIIIIHYYI
jgi:hypothetical protein